MLQQAESKEKERLSLVVVKRSEHFGVVEFDADMNAISIEEKQNIKISDFTDRFTSMTMMW